MKHLLKYMCFLFVIISCITENKKTKIANDCYIKIDSLLQKKNPRKFNGVILITKNGKKLYSKTNGYSNFEGKTPISLNDNFRIQSNSKQITAVLILKEVEKGTINLQAPIKKYLPNLTQNWANQVTVHQLLNMSSGIVDINKPLLFKPGKGYKYSNLAYGLLGEIIENVTKKSHKQVANNLFKKLKMENTFCYDLENKNQRLINGYWVDKRKVSLAKFNELGITKDWWHQFVPAGGIISNVNDMAIWDSKLHNGKTLTPKTYKLMTNYIIKGKHSAFGNKEIGYGYGIRIDDINTPKVIGHAGKGLGFVSMKFYIPSRKINVIILENVFNEDQGIVYYFENEIRKIILKSKLFQ